MSQTKHKFITNTQTSIGYVKIITKIAIYKNFGKQLYMWADNGLKRCVPLIAGFFVKMLRFR